MTGDMVDEETGEFIPGLRKEGEVKENRPNPIVQMGCSWTWTASRCFCGIPRQ